MLCYPTGCREMLSRFCCHQLGPKSPPWHYCKSNEGAFRFSHANALLPCSKPQRAESIRLMTKAPIMSPTMENELHFRKIQDGKAHRFPEPTEVHLDAARTSKAERAPSPCRYTLFSTASPFGEQLEGDPPKWSCSRNT